MEMRVDIAPNGRVAVETISALEDLWHDFEYFRNRANELDDSASSPTDQLIAKRYRRAALLMLLIYFEGVLNQWLQHLLPTREWLRSERNCLELKIDAIQQRFPRVPGSPLDVKEAKRLRNMLVHLKPGSDGELYDKITQDLLCTAERDVSVWLIDAERQLGLKRHYNTELESRELRQALGETIEGTEGYTGVTEE